MGELTGSRADVILPSASMAQWPVLYRESRPASSSNTLALAVKDAINWSLLPELHVADLEREEGGRLPTSLKGRADASPDYQKEKAESQGSNTRNICTDKLETRGVS